MPADDPIIVDDGGSLRIKQALRPGHSAPQKDMDGLLDQATDTAGGKFKSSSSGSAQIELKIVCIGINGGVTLIPATGSTIVPADHVVQVTAGDHKATFDLAFSGVLTLSVEPRLATGAKPRIEAREVDPQRLYIVSNAGSITKVEHGPRPGPAAPALTNVPLPPDRHLTSVHLG